MVVDIFNNLINILSISFDLLSKTLWEKKLYIFIVHHFFFWTFCRTKRDGLCELFSEKQRHKIDKNLKNKKINYYEFLIEWKPHWYPKNNTIVTVCT